MSQSNITATDTLRLAVVGVGHRAGSFLEGAATTFRDQVTLVAMCDANPQRLDHYTQKLRTDWDYPKLPAVYDADNLDTMIREEKPDLVLVCTPDYLHAPLVCRVLEAGADVIVEKPLAIDADGCNAIMETAAKSGRSVRVAFNCRYLPAAELIKQQLLDGVIGEIISSAMDYTIGVEHGATYFGRWHAQKDRSGGLLIHKSSHHFDMMNWWLDGVPQMVYAAGRRGFFGADNQHKHGIESEAAHYLDEDAGNDPFARVFMKSPTYRDLYLKASEHDGYRGDRSVWRENDMDIEDAMAVTVQYRTGQLFTYTLNAFGPISGFTASFNGTKGRLEYRTRGDAHLRTNDDDPKNPPLEICTVYPLDALSYDVPIPTIEGSHGGSDPRMMGDLFARTTQPDQLARRAGAQQGAASSLMGVAANQSIATNRPITMDELTAQFKGHHQLHELI